MSSVLECFHRSIEKIKRCFNGFTGRPQPEEEPTEGIDDSSRIRSNSISQASLELTSHYRKNSIVNTIPIAANSSVISRRSTSSDLNAWLHSIEAYP